MRFECVTQRMKGVSGGESNIYLLTGNYIQYPVINHPGKEYQTNKMSGGGGSLSFKQP